jgi:hypothetical protein
MENIIRWVRATGGWVRSPYGDLPSLRAEDTSVHQTWLILAGGIGLILSRASRAEQEERFAAAREVYAIARTRLHKRRLPKPDLHLLRDALHEIATLADPMTKEAGRECLTRAVERAASKNKGKGAAPATGISTLSTTSSQALTSSHAPLTTAAAPLAPTPAEAEDVHATKIDLELLFERSNKLRHTVAWKRSTTFGPDN